MKNVYIYVLVFSLMSLCPWSYANASGNTNAPVFSADQISLRLKDALQCVNRYFAQNRILRQRLIAVSASIGKEPKTKKLYWKITFRRKREAGRSAEVVVHVQMDGTVNQYKDVKMRADADENRLE